MRPPPSWWRRRFAGTTGAFEAPGAAGTVGADRPTWGRGRLGKRGAILSVGWRPPDPAIPGTAGAGRPEGGALTTIGVWPDEMPTPSRSLPAPSEAPVPATPASYEQALAELERLVADMEAGQLPLDRLLEGYRRGAELLAFCRGRLEAVEVQVRVLEDGQLRPWIES